MADTYAMRARSIKPGFFKNPDIAELPPTTRLIFIGLWTLADREGLLEDHPKKIKFSTCPFDGFDPDEALEQLQEIGVIVRYQDSKGRGVIHVVNFGKHQRPHPKETASILEKQSLREGPTKDTPRNNLDNTQGTPKVNQGKTRVCPFPSGPSGSSDPSEPTGPSGIGSDMSSSGQLDLVSVSQLPVVVDPTPAKMTQVEEQVSQVLAEFKTITGKHRVSIKSEANRKFVRARLQTDRITTADLLAIIQLKSQQAERGEFPGKYLRIETLFNATKCQSYLSELDGVQEVAQESKRTRNNRLALQAVLSKNSLMDGGINSNEQNSSGSDRTGRGFHGGASSNNSPGVSESNERGRGGMVDQSNQSPWTGEQVFPETS